MASVREVITDAHFDQESGKVKQQYPVQDCASIKVQGVEIPRTRGFGSSSYYLIVILMSGRRGRTRPVVHAVLCLP
jgi:hypothetical protein